MALGDEAALGWCPLFANNLTWEAFESDLFDDDSLGAKLLRLGGCEVRVHRDFEGDAAAIYYRELLPQNFAPLLILDASGELRVTYQVWQQWRGGLV
jgi:hypothetical protein